jgi:hypothetical protein
MGEPAYWIMFFVLIAGGQTTAGHIQGISTKEKCEAGVKVMIDKLGEPHPMTGQPVMSYVKAWCQPG